MAEKARNQRSFQSINRAAGAAKPKFWLSVFAGAAAVASLAGSAHATIMIDGSLDSAYGPAASTPSTVSNPNNGALQTNDTGFGDNTDSSGLTANGSELDAAYGVVQGGNLDLFFAGNLETGGQTINGSQTSYNHLNVFIADGRSGQSTINATGSLGAMNGSTFSPGFSATYALDINGGGTNPLTWYIDSYDMTATTAVDHYEGSFNPTVGSPSNPANGNTVSNLTFSFNNSNTAGVAGNGGVPTAANQTAAAAVTTGFEMAIPLSTLGSPHGGSIEVLADINGSNDNYLSNQFLPGLPVENNLGTSTFNFSSTAGQYFTISVPSNPNQIVGTWTASAGGSWNTAANWAAGNVPQNAGDTATFGSSITSAASVTLDGNKTVGEITFNNSTASYFINPGTGGTLTIDDTGDTPVNPFISVEAGSHVIAVPVSLANGVTVTTADSTSLGISGAISGTGPLTKAGGGNLVLSAANSYTGITAILDGDLHLQNASAVPGEIDIGEPADGVLSNLIVDPGLSFNNSIVTIEDGSGSDNDRVITLAGAGTATFNGPLSLNGGAILAAGSGNEIVYNGAISDGSSTDSVAKHDVLINSVGATLGGTVYLTNTNTYSGITAIDAGTLLLNNSSAIGSAGIVYIGNGTQSPTFGDINAALLVNTAGVTIGNTLVTNQADDGTSVGIGTRIIGGTNPSGTVTYSGNLYVNGGTVLSAAAGGTVSFTGIIQDGTGGGNFSRNVTISGPGTVTFSNVNTYSGATLVNAGALNVLVGGALPTTTDLTVGDGTDVAKVSLPAAAGGAGIQTITLDSITLQQNATLSVAAPDVQSDRSVIATNNLTFNGTLNNWQGLLDLNTNDMIVHAAGSSTLFPDITNQIKEAFSGGTWTGTAGITSSALKTAVAVNPGNKTLGVELNDDGTGTSTALISTFDSQSTVDGDVLVKYTYFGDANLDGVVDASDYLAIDNGFNSRNSSNPLTGWQNGDFNYDGVINGDDYTLIDNAYNTQNGVSLASVGSPLAVDTSQIASVPEPASLGLIAIGAVGLLNRRRRRI